MSDDIPIPAGVELMGARGYDPLTASFLSVDPLAPVAGAAWGSNPYSFAGNNPVNQVDPWGLRPITDAELADYQKAHQGILADAGDFLADNWEYLAAAGMVIAGGVLMATGVGGPVGLMLVQGGISVGVQKAITGSVDPLQTALDMVPGGPLVQGLAGSGSAAYSYMRQPGSHSATGLLSEVTLAASVAALPGPSSAGKKLTDEVVSVGGSKTTRVIEGEVLQPAAFSPSPATVHSGQKAIGPGVYGTLPALPPAQPKLQNLSPQVIPHDYPLAQNAWIMNKDGVAVGNTNADRFAKVLNDSPVWDGPYPTRSPGQQWVSTFDGSIIRIMESNTGTNPNHQHHILRAVYERENPAGLDKKPLKLDPATWDVPKPDAGLKGHERSIKMMEKSHLPLHRYE